MRKLPLFLLFFLISTGCSVGNRSSYVYYEDKYQNKKKSSSYKERRLSNKHYTMRPYKRMGKYYYPTYVKVGDSMRGIASWYGPKFHGKITSSGERYNMYGITVAHKTWPMHTMVRVTNLDNGKSIIARINDRGPFVKGRIVDCSYGVAKKLDIMDKGTCNVRLDVVGFNGKLYRANSNKRDIKSKVKLNNFGVQVGAFTVLENAKKHKEKYKKVVSKPYYVKIKRTTQHSTGRELYRVLVMGFNSKEEAENFIYRENITGGFVILGD